MTKEQRIEKAKALRSQGYNCAQCVAMSMTDLTGIDENTAARSVAGLGGGVGGQGEICGVIGAFAHVAGMLGDASPKGKHQVYSTVRKLTDDFRQRLGCTLCRELKGRKPPVACNDLIFEGTGILHDHFCGDEA